MGKVKEDYQIISEVIEVPVAAIKPNKENPRFISKHKFKSLVKSLQDFPEMLLKRPVIVNEEFVILGGNTDALYQGDGRIKMARALERMWPGIVTVDRRFKRPQHIIKNAWKNFDTPLIRRKDIDFDKLQVNEYGMTLTKKAEIESEDLIKLYNLNPSKNG